jgi:hypothetical protein
LTDSPNRKAVVVSRGKREEKRLEIHNVVVVCGYTIDEVVDVFAEDLEIFILLVGELRT